MNLILAVSKGIEQTALKHGLVQGGGVALVLADPRQHGPGELEDIGFGVLTVAPEGQQGGKGLGPAEDTGEGLDLPVGEEIGLNDHAR